MARLIYDVEYVDGATARATVSPRAQLAAESAIGSPSSKNVLHTTYRWCYEGLRLAGDDTAKGKGFEEWLDTVEDVTEVKGDEAEDPTK